MIHRKHKLIGATLVALSLTALSACGSDAEPKAVETVTETVEAEPTPAAAPAEGTDTTTTDESAGAESSEPAAPEAENTTPTQAETQTESASEEPIMDAGHELPKQEAQEMMGDGKAEFIHFTVESLPPPTQPPSDSENAWAYVRTCLNSTPWEFIDTGKTPISASAYGIELSPSGKKLKQVTDNALKPAYPIEGELSPHDCAEGFITFEPITEDIDALTVTYDNSLGEHAAWNYH